jgi:hypothetical protein
MQICSRDCFDVYPSATLRHTTKLQGVSYQAISFRITLRPIARLRLAQRHAIGAVDLRTALTIIVH